MSDVSLPTVLRTFESQRIASSRKLASLEADLAAEQALQEHLAQAIQAIQAMTRNDDSNATQDASAAPLLPPAPAGEDFDFRLEGGRVRSVEMVRFVVEESRSGLTREELHQAFFARWGEQTWINPRNALSTAIARAVERGIVREGKDGKLRRAK
ncbi:hypothetical protein [Leucobacter iarius]|uniref:Uncharacterized protein n=1 Tax=Leucobacter iarius TaxID=333963 RepID=A0ABN2LAF3_9MICO